VLTKDDRHAMSEPPSPAPAAIAAHYDRVARTPESRQARARSRAIGVRAYHNACKRALLERYGARGNHVLNVACGRDADVGKHLALGTASLTGVDVSAASLAEVRRRAHETRRARVLPLELYALDMTRAWTREYARELAEHGRGAFALVCCFFAAHYAFATEQDASTLLANASQCLAAGGRLLLIVPDAEAVLRAAAAAAATAAAAAAGAPGTAALFSIELRESARVGGDFGGCYRFHFADGLVAGDEYLVHRHVLVRLARAHSLELVLEAPLPRLGEALEDARLRASGARLDARNADVSALYVAYVFRSPSRGCA